MHKLLTIILLFLAIIILPFCKTAKSATGNRTAKPVTYTADVAPIIMDRCTPCHFPESGKKKFLDTYAAVSTTIDSILVRVQLPTDHPKFMPFKSKKEPLSDSLITVLKVWRETGMAK